MYFAKYMSIKKKIITNFLILLNKFELIKKIFNIIRNLENFECITYKNLHFYFISRNWTTNYRYTTFVSKEPDTIKWIEEMSQDSIFWDVGANIGLYSIFAAKFSSSKVYAFEPSFLNLEILYKNINLNDQKENITIVPISLNSNSQEGYFELGSLNHGGALSNFVQKNKLNVNCDSSYKTISISPSNFQNVFSLKKPDYIKIDVDGLEYEILKGLEIFLIHTKSVLIEINLKNLTDQENINNLLKKNNFYLSKKGILPNQIWCKQ